MTMEAFIKEEAIRDAIKLLDGRQYTAVFTGVTNTVGAADITTVEPGWLKGILTELLALRHSRASGVRALQWRKRRKGVDEWNAHSPVGMYEVGDVHGRWSALLRYVDDDCQTEDLVIGWFDSAVAAKAAAQSHFNAAIQSCLVAEGVET